MATNHGDDGATGPEGTDKPTVDHRPKTPPPEERESISKEIQNLAIQVTASLDGNNTRLNKLEAGPSSVNPPRREPDLSRLYSSRYDEDEDDYFNQDSKRMRGAYSSCYRRSRSRSRSRGRVHHRGIHDISPSTSRHGSPAPLTHARQSYYAHAQDPSQDENIREEGEILDDLMGDDEEEEDIFSNLTDRIAAQEATGPKIKSEFLVASVAKIFDNPPTGKLLEEMREKYLRPENVPHLQIPSIEKEVWGALSKQGQWNDSYNQRVQGVLMGLITAQVKSVDELGILRKSIKGPQTQAELKRIMLNLQEGVSMMAFLNKFVLVKQRREALKPHLKEGYKDMATNHKRFPSTASNLLGANLEENIKSLETTKKLSRIVETGYQPKKGQGNDQKGNGGGGGGFNKGNNANKGNNNGGYQPKNGGRPSYKPRGGHQQQQDRNPRYRDDDRRDYYPRDDRRDQRSRSNRY